MAKQLFLLLLLLFLCFSFFTFVSSSQNESGPVFACKSIKDMNKHQFCNQSLDLNSRVEDLVGKLTMKEKIGWMSSTSSGVKRLGIPSYEWWSEALHGVAGSPGVHFSAAVPRATSFPQVILTAATFDAGLFEAVGKAVSTEARAMYNVGLSGLTLWAPNVNIFRDPRWGRGQETPGEDPYLSGIYAATYVAALQHSDDGDNNKLKVAACCKHYTAYDLDNWKGVDRYNFNALVTQIDLEDTFQVPFRSCVTGGDVASVMCSFNQVNGKPTCGDPEFLNGVIRGRWNFNGFIVSDCDSLQAMYSFQHYTKTPEETAALAVNSGLDLNCGRFLSSNAFAAVNRGLLNETAINRAISYNFATMMRLGFFDGPPSKRVHGNLGPKDICTKENQELALEVARQGIVLLKNRQATLPLVPLLISTVAVIGPNGNATETMLGNDHGIPCNYTSPLQGISEIATSIYEPGCSSVACETADIELAKSLASAVDAVMLVVGSDNTLESEGLDRVGLTLPGQQQLLVSEVAKASKGPVILVIMSGGGMDIQFAKDDPKVSSILWVGFPGEAGGKALADIVFGYHSPSGRLPMTWYPQSYVEKVDMTDMNMRANPLTGYPGRTYRFYEGPAVYDFAEGLTYSEFSHSIIDAPRILSASDIRCKDKVIQDSDFVVHIKARNVGRMRGGHTVLLFWTPPRVRNAPLKQLVGFHKFELMPNEEGEIRFNMSICKHLSLLDENGEKKIELGEHLLHVGSLTHSLNLNV